ncbi:ChbG/HpnK family deacetylase [Streptomyces sp. So13.3]|uniref:polysaccharide deacetylase family protein n=1 Tax=Streptomyces TaxID=1883 RepID=UPI001106BF47|nr:MULTISPECIES: polysaccharide deacetylase family protein [Streptomyces]MCZ4101240.1 polysaccharide deacetylase family protein [Streptomyces sp. H39-C1]QNA77244.1 ChbG/HpnK family deacetylase [Streptomyces sp. So13.3]
MDADALSPSVVPPSLQSSELLGFPPDARLLIVNCDDFGMYPEINTAVVESIEQGIASSCSLMALCPSAPHAMQLLGRRPGMAFGIHLTLVCEVTHSRWAPITAREKVPSLLNKEGELFAPTPAGRATLLGQARLDEVELEFRAQINAVADRGLTPTHLDFHCLADGGRDDILDLTVGLAAEYGLAVRVWLAPGRRTVRSLGRPVIDNDFLDSFSLDIAGKAARYEQLLHDLPAGLNEWAVHPGLGGQESQAVDDGWLVRRTDHEFLTSPQAYEVLREEGIVVIDYRAIQQVWSRNTGP